MENFVKSAQRLSLRRWIAVAAGSITLVGMLSIPAAQATPTPANRGVAVDPDDPIDYCLDQCSDILPPGQNGNATFTQLLLFQAFGARPAHNADSLSTYENLAWNHKGITDDQLTDYFDVASFTVPEADVASTESPRPDVTITRDVARGIPHIKGTTREGTMFGAGYAGAQDRLFVMDIFRHLGRGQLTPFAGGAESNQALEQDLWANAPYTEADLQDQYDSLDDRFGADGVRLQNDTQAYVDGVNHYIDTMGVGSPGEYVALGLGTPDPWKVTDVVATGAVVAGIFGTGGGNEMKSALALIEARLKYGTTTGTNVWKGFRSQNDVEANTTVHGKSFPYGQTVENPAGRALPDAGTVVDEPLVADRTGSAVPTSAAGKQAASGTQPSSTDEPTGVKSKEDLRGIFDGGVLPEDFGKKGMSNALLVSGANTQSGHPVAVFGPQTGYMSPQLWMRQSLVGPGVASRGASFAGLNYATLVGRGVDYSWSPTSAGQDITDSFALRLCNPHGGTVAANSTHYLFRGACTPMEKLQRTNEWSASLGSSVPTGSYKLVAWRTKLGIVTHRGTVAGKPVAYVKLRSTYMNELGASIGFSDFGDPDRVTSATTFQQSAAKIGYTFNWFYADKDDIAYYNSGDNPVRAGGADPNLPTWGDQKYEWKDWNPTTNKATYTSFAQHPQAINQSYLTSWNNKQAPGYSAADGNFSQTAVHRVDMLDVRINKVLNAGQKFTRAKLVEVMQDAATTDLRGQEVLPLLLRVLRSQPISDPVAKAAVGKLEAWLDSTSQRRAAQDPNVTGVYAYDHKEAIAIMDAWWPLLVKGQFEPQMGAQLYTKLTSVMKIDERANPLGSAYQYGWWGFVERDLRKVLGDTVKTPQPVTFCGAGSLAACRTMLISTLKAAKATPLTTTYPETPECTAGDQFCTDQVVHTALGGFTQYKMAWTNRPTYQQVVEFPARRGDNVANLAKGKSATASSYQSNIFVHYPAMYAVDADPSSRWASYDWDDDEWITVDLGTRTSVGRAVLRWEYAYGKRYEIQVSDDGTNWRSVAEVEEGDGGVDTITFAPTQARYVRMQGLARGTTYGWSLYDFAVYAH